MSAAGPWSPSLAREAARAEFCAIRTQGGPVAPLVAEQALVGALLTDRAFDSPIGVRALSVAVGPWGGGKLAALVGSSR